MVSPVESTESVYRSVPRGRGWLKPDANGDCQPTSAAFLDRAFQVSVDRACLVSGPDKTQMNSDDGVLILRVSDITALEPAAGKHVTVDPNPVDGNPAHALICLDPHPENSTQFKKLRESLKRVATWVIRPGGECD